MLNMKDPSIYETFGEAIHYEAGRQVPLDVALAEARRLRNREMDRLFRAAGKRVAAMAVSMFGPMFGWNRHQIDPRVRHERQASLDTFVRALRADAEAAKQDRWLGHKA